MGLVDAKGNPLMSGATAKEMYAKAAPPQLGEKFGPTWGSDLQRGIMRLLGHSGLVQFDLTKLTLADFRVMRDHYQINACLSAMTFMLHQMDWKIECKNKKIKQHVEDNMSEIWTVMIRSMSQAHWAGFSPNILQWENDPSSHTIQLTKIKDLIPEFSLVNWKQVDGFAPPGHIPPKIDVYDGIRVFGQAWPVPVDNSMWYPLLAENGDMYGRKLLRSAFTSWYFSLLMHLYANRYFERFGEPVPIGRAPYTEEMSVNVDGTVKKVNGAVLMTQILQNLRNRSVVVLPNDRTAESNSLTGTGAIEYDYDIKYLECVDEETQIFTKRGWLEWDVVTEDDETLTLNHVTGQSEWQKIQKVNISGVEDKSMLLMDSQNHSSLTTLNHRWPVINGWNASRDWRFSKDLKQRDSIPLRAERHDVPVEQKYEDAFVELVAWYWTEGYLFKTGNYCSIHQKRYPEKIRSALTRLFGRESEGFASAVGSTALSGFPQWRENGKTGDELNRQFFLNYEATNLLNSVCPDKIVTREFILSLTKSQLELYIQTALLADGNVTSRQTFLMQKSRKMAEMFEFACIQAGYATSFYYAKPDIRFPDDTGMWVVSVKRTEVFKPYNQRKEIVKYSGFIWCPTTPNGSWLARRDGKVFFTGNSQMRGADFERILSRLDEEMSLSMFTPLLVLRTSDVGSYNLGSTHWTMYQNMLNALAGDMKLYIDKFIISRMVAFNFGKNAPKARITFRKMGDDKQATITAILQALIPTGTVKVDLDQLGEIAGVGLTEQKVLTAPADGTPPPVAGTTKPKATATGGGKQKKPAAKKPSTNSMAILDDVAGRVQAQILKALSTDGKDVDGVNIAMGYERRLSDSLELDGFEDAEELVRYTYRQAAAMISELTLHAFENLTPGNITAYLRSIIGSCLEIAVER